VGFDNFKVLWNDMNFIQSFQNSIVLIVLVAIITLVIAIFFAAVLTKENVVGNNFFRIVFYIPNILSIVVIAGVFSAIYDPASGLLNSVFGVLSLDSFKQMWLGNQDIVIYSIAGALVWQAVGYYMVMYMSSMASIPASYYEAAELEGAGKFKQFTSITLPDRKSTRLNSSHVSISYAVFCYSALRHLHSFPTRRSSDLKQMWLGNQDIVIYSIAGALVWQAVGYYMVMYMSSMASIPASYYEAAELEGAGKFKQFTSITL